jgi:predicted HAD superfamily Cof-like phosphohydrolase
MSAPADMVRARHTKYGQPVREVPSAAPVTYAEQTLRRALIREELAELDLAMAAEDVVHVADALADLIYVVWGTALHYGIDLDAVLAEVHRSNMTKEYDPSRAKYAGKVIVKGAAFEPPLIAAVLGVRS